MPRFQITLRGILLATFWMAICCGGFVADRSIPPRWEFRGPEMLFHVQKDAIFYIFAVSPFIAVGVLLGRAMAGAIIGIMATSALFVVASLQILFLPVPPELRNGLITSGALHAIVIVAGLWVLFRRRRSADASLQPES